MKLSVHFLLVDGRIRTSTISDPNPTGPKKRTLPMRNTVVSSVPEPDPDPPDPHVFGPPGSFYQHAKIVRKTLIPYIL